MLFTFSAYFINTQPVVFQVSTTGCVTLTEPVLLTRGCAVHLLCRLHQHPARGVPGQCCGCVTLTEPVLLTRGCAVHLLCLLHQHPGESEHLQGGKVKFPQAGNTEIE